METDGGVLASFEGTKLPRLLAAVKRAHPAKVVQTSKDIAGLFQDAAGAKPGFDKVAVGAGVAFDILTSFSFYDLLFSRHFEIVAILLK